MCGPPPPSPSPPLQCYRDSTGLPELRRVSLTLPPRTVAFCVCPFRSLESPVHAVRRAGLKAGKPAAFARGDRLHRHHKATRDAHACDSIGSTAARAAGGFVCIGRSTAPAVGRCDLPLHRHNNSSRRWFANLLAPVCPTSLATGCRTSSRQWLRHQVAPGIPQRPGLTTRGRAPWPLVQQPPDPTG